MWANDVRLVTVVRVDLGVPESDFKDATAAGVLAKFHKAVLLVQKGSDMYEGSLLDVSFDDKTCTVIVVFGLPPKGHSDDPLRAVLATLHCMTSLASMGLIASAGISSGECFVGSAGSDDCRRLSVFGEAMNSSLSFLSAAKGMQVAVLCGENTRAAVGELLTFQPGKTVSGLKSFQPIPANDNATAGSCYKTQLRSLHRFKREHHSQAKWDDDMKDNAKASKILTQLETWGKDKIKVLVCMS